MAYELNGSSWIRISPVSRDAWSLEGQGGLISVSCSGPIDCVAVGPIQIHRLDAALVERLHGGSWIPTVGAIRQRPPQVDRKRGV